MATRRFVLSEAQMELETMEMDFMGAGSVPATQQGTAPLVARCGDDEAEKPSRLSGPNHPSPARPPHGVNPDVPAGASHHHTGQHSAVQSSQVHATGTRASQSPSPQPQPASSLTAASTRGVVDGVGAAPASMGFQTSIPTSYLQGSKVPHNAASTATPRCLTSQLTIFYAGSVHVFDNVKREQAEQIMLMAAKATQPPVPLPLLQPESAATLPNERQMSAAKACNDPVRLSPDTTMPHAVLMPGDVPLARNASLARFLERRRQRVASSAMPYSRREKSPGKKGNFPIVSPGNGTPFCNTEQSLAVGNARGMNGSCQEEALDRAEDLAAVQPSAQFFFFFDTQPNFF